MNEMLVDNYPPHSALVKSGSTYCTKKDSEKAEIFRKPYVTFLNIPQLERLQEIERRQQLLT